ncbi:MAG TPA: aspartate aminotransferase family protein [Bacteroidales bacterium]|nr:aspartate aminotransferase family protein [Bacteroidales bacterium]
MTNHQLKAEGDINLTEARTRWHGSLSSETSEILAKDSRIFLHQSLSTPCLDVLTGCEGVYIINHNGRKIFDFHGNNLHQVGHKNPYVIDAIKKQLDELSFSPRRYTNIKAINLANRLSALAPPDLNRVLFAPGGAEANSMALKLARIVTGKHKVLSMWGSFHGAGLDTISASGESGFRKNIGPLLPGVEHVPAVDTYRPLWENDSNQEALVRYIRYVFETEGDIGAFIAETIRNTDVQVPPISFWQQVRALCNEFGVLLILDEIPIWLGRTGKMFAFEHFGIVPDMVTIGKGLGGGIIPMAALITKDSYNVAIEHSIGHFTHEKSPVGSAAALAVLNFMEKENLLQQSQTKETYIYKRLAAMKERFPIIGDIRGIGLLWAIELVTDRNTKERAYAEAEYIMYQCLENGLSFKVSKGNVITLAPPLIITMKELEEALNILENAFTNQLHRNETK